ncbi:MAG: right-handed parallel beta-helix repeat-containing protein, partial [Planctomycetota bacterium]|nr:right-handed parallel beta-helix repeat-containing protein [Planctomycetota bacterium]
MGEMQMVVAKSKITAACAVVLMTCIVGSMVAETALAGPTITDWFSTGGTPQYKDNVKDLIYKITQGDNVTFSVTAGGTGALSYLWQALKGSKVVATSSAGKTFSWTVPDEKATWDVKVTVSDSGSRSKTHLVWSITTSDVKTVSAGASIQNAIDTLPAEGGIVELGEGTWILTPAAGDVDVGVIRIIQRHNVTLRGAGADKTVLKTASTDVCLVVVSPLEDNDFIIHEAGGGAAQQDPRLKNAPFYNYAVIRDIHFIGPGVRVESGKSIYSILYAKISDSVIEDVKVEKFGDGILLYRCNYNALERVEIVESNRGGLFFSMCEDNRIENCLFERANRWYAFDLNGGGVRNKIIGNTFKANGQGDLKLYSGSRLNEIIGNTFNGAGSSSCGVIIMNGAWNLIQGNVFANHKKITDYAAVVQKSGGGSHPPEYYNHDNKVIDNSFYDSKGDAVLLVVGAPMEVRNNIIVKSAGKAINGIDPVNCSYNDLWQNVGGDTGGGTGSISADPLFADPANGDFHLKSKVGRWNPVSEQWVTDTVNSPCIDAGDPASTFSDEPAPNGGRINMGAYGNTDQASKTEVPAEVKGRHVFYNNSAFDGN